MPAPWQFLVPYPPLQTCSGRSRLISPTTAGFGAQCTLRREPSTMALRLPPRRHRRVPTALPGPPVSAQGGEKSSGERETGEAAAVRGNEEAMARTQHQSAIWSAAMQLRSVVD